MAPPEDHGFEIARDDVPQDLPVAKLPAAEDDSSMKTDSSDGATSPSGLGGGRWSKKKLATIVFASVAGLALAIGFGVGFGRFRSNGKAVTSSAASSALSLTLEQCLDEESSSSKSTKGSKSSLEEPSSSSKSTKGSKSSSSEDTTTTTSTATTAAAINVEVDPIDAKDEPAPTPATDVPTYTVTTGSTPTVSTEVTGPPTTSDREEPKVRELSDSELLRGSSAQSKKVPAEKAIATWSKPRKLEGCDELLDEYYGKSGKSKPDKSSSSKSKSSKSGGCFEHESSTSSSSKSSKSGKSAKKCANRVKELEKEFPCLGSLASQEVVHRYVEKDNTSISSQGLVTEVTGTFYEEVRTVLEATYDQDITKSEMIKLCVTKCELLEDCTIFSFNEGINVNDDKSYSCTFYNKSSIAAQYTVTNPVKSNIGTTVKLDQPKTAFVNFSVFQKGGGELVLPKFKGCKVPVGDNVEIAIECLGIQLGGGTLPVNCPPLLTEDFMTHIAPAIECSFKELGTNLKVQDCLSCLEKVPFTCGSGSICDEDNVITNTKKCTDADKCSASGQVKESCGRCGDVCPQSNDCVSKLQTALLCQAGAEPVFDSKGQFGACLNADNPDFEKDYLDEDGSGNYQCLEI